MSLGDPIGDMLTRIRNGQMRSLNKIEIHFSNFRSKILEVLKREGYIISYETTTNEKKIKSYVSNLKKDKFQFNLKDKKNIFNDKISNIASILAKNKIVRNFILNEQRTCLNSY